MSKEFELARLQMVRAARAEEIDNIRGYAWSHRIYPFNPYELEEAFEKDFKISRDASEEVLKAIDDGWRNNKLVSFYDLEGWPDRSDGLGGMEIFHVCRLAFLDRRFDDAVWQALTIPGSGPETIILANVDGHRKTDNRARQPNSRQQRPNLLTPRQLPCRRTSRTDGLCSRYCRAVEKG